MASKIFQQPFTTLNAKNGELPDYPKDPAFKAKWVPESWH